MRRQSTPSLVSLGDRSGDGCLGLDRTLYARRAFDEPFGSPDMSTAQFTARYAGHVRITHLCEVPPPTVAAALER